MGAITISLEDSDTKGRYVAHVEGFEDTGELTFSRTSPLQVIVDHTGVPDTLRGQGVGAALAARIVADAREKGFKIIPLCPFFKGQAEKNPDWADVVRMR